jgi:predicted PurR-regulated permease PerM
MNKIMNKVEFKKWISNFLLIIAGLAFYQVLRDLSSIRAGLDRFTTILFPFILGLTIAYLINIPATKIEKLLKKIKNTFINKRSRGLSIIFAYLSILITGSILLNIIIPAIVLSVVELTQVLPTMFEESVAFVTIQRQNEVFPYNLIPYDLFNNIQMSNIVNSGIFTTITENLMGILGITSFVINIALAVIASIYFLIDAENFKSFTVRVLRVLFPEKELDMFFKYCKNTNDYFRSYLYCLTLDAVIYGVISIIGLYLIGVDYALVLGVLLGVFNLIPFFGAIVMSITAIIIILITQGMTMGIYASIFLIISQQIDGNYIQPKLISGSLKLSPILIIMGITIGAAYLGIVGMIIATPIVAIIRTITLDYIEY